MIDVEFKNNVLVKPDNTAVNLQEDIYRRVDGFSNFKPFVILGCNQLYKVTIRYVVVGASELSETLQDLFGTDKTIISTDTRREVILREERLSSLLLTSLEKIFKIVYEQEIEISKDDCIKLNCYC